MPTQPTLLKVLLRQRHWQKYATFCNEYDRAARDVDPALVATWPSRAQLHRWLSGDVKGLPYPDHCRILEKMFPGWSAEQLFAPYLEETVNGRADVHTEEHSTAPSVTMPAVAIRPHVERAFEHKHVTIDFSGFSGETLHGVIQEPLDKVRVGQLQPETVVIRLLLPDTSAPMVVPCRKEGLADDPQFRERAHQIMVRHALAILDSVHELSEMGLVASATAHIRLHNCSPLFKLYILNQQEAFFGFYPIREHAVAFEGTPRVMYDLIGKETILFHHSAGDESSSYVDQSRLWFETMWDTISHDFMP